MPVPLKLRLFQELLRIIEIKLNLKKLDAVRHATSKLKELKMLYPDSSYEEHIYMAKLDIQLAAKNKTFEIEI